MTRAARPFVGKFAADVASGTPKSKRGPGRSTPSPEPPRVPRGSRQDEADRGVPIVPGKVLERLILKLIVGERIPYRVFTDLAA
jgi:hypothetical protein